ncbi:DUF721 domain-containing protein [Pseudomonas sp. TTU2014-080ASC]|uniref:DUF721 domain-containing protein n=1 Tax=Pseudomonas sp. TTU2014-080ASC TaxID=1729724 RepID=UPI0007187733|nr:DciA family protein [Pseudomonas sp. TTU2014-080ASC]KRW62721.1 RNA-binding protein [Pseudomonas sp. TTU2014-080ASC]
MTYRPSPARSPAALLREAKPLQGLLRQAQHIDRLQQLLDSQLQPAAREHCRVATFRDGCLLLIITDGHWATRLRYQQKRLLKQLQALEAFATLTKILIKVQPSTAEMGNTLHSATLSNSAAQHIQASVEGISDPRLRAALERLAQHGQKNRTP